MKNLNKNRKVIGYVGEVEIGSRSIRNFNRLPCLDSSIAYVRTVKIQDDVGGDGDSLVYKENLYRLVSADGRGTMQRDNWQRDVLMCVCYEARYGGITL
jgi:hypothetical protein